MLLPMRSSSACASGLKAGAARGASSACCGSSGCAARSAAMRASAAARSAGVGSASTSIRGGGRGVSGTVVVCLRGRGREWTVGGRAGRPYRGATRGWS